MGESLHKAVVTTYPCLASCIGRPAHIWQYAARAAGSINNNSSSLHSSSKNVWYRSLTRSHSLSLSRHVIQQRVMLTNKPKLNEYIQIMDI